jgi:hypothetical protein
MALPDNLPLPRGAPLDEQDREGWRITDERSAEWVMRKLARARERMAEQAALRVEYLEQLEEWWNDATRSLRGDIEWATDLLSGWAMTLRDADPDEKTQVLPSGRVSTRWVPPHPQADDPEALATSLARAGHPSFDVVVSTNVKVDARELAKIVGVADEWHVSLSCGCTVTTWRFDTDLSVGQPWPMRVEDHQDRACRATEATIVALRRGRVSRVVVAANERVVPLDGVTMVPGRVTATVQPR